MNSDSLKLGICLQISWSSVDLSSGELPLKVSQWLHNSVTSYYMWKGWNGTKPMFWIIKMCTMTPTFTNLASWSPQQHTKTFTDVEIVKSHAGKRISWFRKTAPWCACVESFLYSIHRRFFHNKSKHLVTFAQKTKFTGYHDGAAGTVWGGKCCLMCQKHIRHKT